MINIGKYQEIPKCQEITNKHCCHSQWLVVFAAFMNSVIIDGMFLSFGILRLLLEEYLPTMERTSFYIYWIGSLQISAQMILGPLIIYLKKKFGIRIVAVTGGCLSGVSHIVCFLAPPNIWIFYVFYGIIGGFGLGMTYMIGILSASQYLTPKRLLLGLGITSIGTGLGICIMGHIIHAVVNQYSWHGLILIIAAFSFQTVPFSFLLTFKQINPANSQNRKQCSWKKSFQCFRNRKLCLYFLSAFLFSLSITLPYYYTPIRMIDDYNFNDIQAIVILSLIGIGSLCGRTMVALVGIMKLDLDKMIWLYMSALLAGGLWNVISSVFVSYNAWIFWGLMAGIPSGMIVALTVPILKKLTGDEMDYSYGYFIFSRGCGMVLGPPLAGLLYDLFLSYNLIFYLLGALFILGGLLTIPMHV